MTDRRSLSLGAILVGLGIFFLLRSRIGFSGPGPILLLLGAIFLTLSALRRFRGPLVPGAVLLGLGAAFLLQDPLAPFLPRWATLVLGIAAGFLLVALLDAATGRRRRPSAALPGAVLAAVAGGGALARWTDLSGLAEAAMRLWPWVLVAAGAILLATSLRRRRA